MSVLWWSVFFQICQEKDTKKKQISGFYERGKKEEVLTSDEKGDEKNREISKSKILY